MTPAKRPPQLERKYVDLEIKEKPGQVPPHDLDAEAAVLSACMLATHGPNGLGSSIAYLQVADILKSTMFYSEKHARIFEAIELLTLERRPIDVVTVGGCLKDRERLAQVGGMPYLGEILDSAPVVSNVRAYAEKIIETWRLRRFMLRAQQIYIGGYGDVGGIPHYLATSARELATLAEASTGKRSSTIEMHPLMKECFANIRTAHEEGRPPGISTGFRAFDRITDGGLHRGDVTIIAARPGMGKTAAMLCIALNVAGQEPMIVADDGKEWADQAVAFFSLEMPREQIGNRMISIQSGVPFSRIRTGRCEPNDWTPLQKACLDLSDYSIEVDDTSGLDLRLMRSKIHALKAKLAEDRAGRRKRRLAAVFFDYLQLGKDPNARTRIEEIGSLTRGFKEVAKEEDVAVVIGCQLNREVEKRTGSKRPVLIDLRESGDVEQDADNVVGLYRGSYYGEPDPEGEEGHSEWIVLKQRGGKTGTVVTRWQPSTMFFDNMPGHT